MRHRDESELPPFDEDFVRSARIRESELDVTAKPSRDSMREVRREAKKRKKGLPLLADTERASSSSNRLKATVTLIALAGGLVGLFAWVRSSEPRRPAAKVPVVVPSTAETPTAVPDGGPFADTPVEDWPVGAAGIKAPIAKPVDRFAAAQVAHAYARTAKYLRVALLDPNLLYKGDLKSLRGTVSAYSFGQWDEPVSKGPDRRTPAALSNRFSTDVVSASPEIRVNGYMAARRGERRTLWVSFTYVSVYVVRPPTAPTDTELVAIRRIGTLEFTRFDAKHVSLPWVARASYTSDHSRCKGTWPHPEYLQVYFEEPSPASTPTSEPTAIDPLEEVNLLDPRAKEPDRCFTNTGRLK